MTDAPKLDFVSPSPVLWAWRCPNDGTLHWYHDDRACSCGFVLTVMPPGGDPPQRQGEPIADYHRRIGRQS